MQILKPWLLIVNVLLQLAEGHKQLTEPKRGNLKMCGDRFGDLTIDHTLVAGQVKAFKGGHLVFEAPSDETLHALLTQELIRR